MSEEWDDITYDAEDMVSMWPEDMFDEFMAGLKGGEAPTKRDGSITGADFVKWVMEMGYVSNTEEALELGSVLIHRGLVTTNKEGGKFKNKPTYIVKVKGARAAAAAPKTAESGVTWEKAGDHVLVKIIERQRRSGAGWAPNSGQDPPAWSCEKDAVQLPSVNGAPPSQCEWAGDWDVVTGANTAKDGWVYSESFTPGAASSTTEVTSKHHTRTREWVRSARKVPDRKRTDTSKRSTLSAAQERRKPRAPRSGVVEVTVESGTLPRQCDSAVTVEYRDEKNKSATAKKAAAHKWDFTSSLAVENDMEPIRISVWQVSTVGKRLQMGQGELFITEGDAAGAATIRLRANLLRNTEDGQKELGSISVKWKFDVRQSGMPSLRALGDVAEKGLLTIAVKGAKGLKGTKKPFGPCGLCSKSINPSPFPRLRYKGDYSEMIADGTTVENSCAPSFGWTTCVAVSSAQPIVVELVCARTNATLGRTNVPFKDACGDTKELRLVKRASEESDAMLHDQPAGVVLVSWTWEPNVAPEYVTPSLTPRIGHGASAERKSATTDLLSVW